MSNSTARAIAPSPSGFCCSPSASSAARWANEAGGVTGVGTRDWALICWLRMPLPALRSAVVGKAGPARGGCRSCRDWHLLHRRGLLGIAAQLRLVSRCTGKYWGLFYTLLKRVPSDAKEKWRVRFRGGLNDGTDG